MIRKCSVTGFFPRMRNLHHPPPQIQCGIYLAPPPPQIQYGICMPPPPFSGPPQHFSNEHSLKYIQSHLFLIWTLYSLYGVGHYLGL